MKKASDKRNKDKRLVAIILIVIGVILLLSLFVLFCGDRVYFKIKFNSRMNDLSSADLDYLLINDPLYDTGYPTASGKEIRITETEQIKEIQSKLYEIYSNSKYHSQEQGTAGNWDLWIRYEIDGKTYTVYLTESQIYFASGTNRIIFKSNLPELNAALVAELSELLNAEDN